MSTPPRTTPREVSRVDREGLLSPSPAGRLVSVLTLALTYNPAVPADLRAEAEREARRFGAPLGELEEALQSEVRCRAFLVALRRKALLHAPLLGPAPRSAPQGA